MSQVEQWCHCHLGMGTACQAPGVAALDRVRLNGCPARMLSAQCRAGTALGRVYWGPACAQPVFVQVQAVQSHLWVAVPFVWDVGELPGYCQSAAGSNWDREDEVTSKSWSCVWEVGSRVF